MTITDQEQSIREENESKQITSVNFNQDFSCISVGTRLGYRIYNCDPFAKCYSKVDSGIGHIEMLFCTSLVALVGLNDNSPSVHLRIKNTKRESTICELTFETPILSVKMNRKRLIVVLEKQIFVYDISNMKLLHTLDTISNPQAICALSPSSDNCYLAYQPLRASDYYTTSSYSNSSPTYNGIGDIEIYDANTMKLENIVQAHKSTISCISMNLEGTLMATASEKGTVIRVFTIPRADKVYQFRRGSYSARIYSMSFNLVSTLLCVSSDTETVHIFKLSSNNDTSGDHSLDKSDFSATTTSMYTNLKFLIHRQRRSSLQNIGRSMGSFLPDRLTDMWEPSRHFASLKLPNVGVRSLVALSSTTPQVLVVTAEGYFYQYNIDLENGGECVLLKRNSLHEPGDMEN
ncbi:WD40-repeat-containing domain protein [Parasitella parasitica]|nr:WD40-repeat-containing domain protein [Parasitella parasitica]